MLLEQFSIECRKTKTKVITTANQNKDKYHNEPVRTQSKIHVHGNGNRSQARENASDQVAIGFSFASDWLRGRREFSRPITERSKEKPMQSRITFDTIKNCSIIATFDSKVCFTVKDPLINVLTKFETFTCYGIYPEPLKRFNCCRFNGNKCSTPNLL